MTDTPDELDAGASTDIIPTSHLQAIGYAVSMWGSFEFKIDRALWRMMGVEQIVGDCVTSQITSIFPKLRSILSLARLWRARKPSVDKLKRYTDSLHTINGKRNRIVHDARFSTDAGEIKRFQNTAASPPIFGIITETPEELADFVREVRKKSLEFSEIWKPLWAEVKGRIGSPPLHSTRIIMSDIHFEDYDSEIE